MIPKIHCSHCNSEIERSDRFCPSCGHAVEWGEASGAQTPEQPGIRCTVCGNLNSADAVSCGACGAALGRTKQQRRAQGPATPRKRDKSPSSNSILNHLQSWKITIGLAVVFIVVLVVIGTRGSETGHVHSPMNAAAPAEAAQLMAEIDQLQKRVDENPTDLRSTLLLANRLHDARFFPRAVSLYERYLRTNPSDADVRVDMGICYFELSMADSSRRVEYIDRATMEMKRALTYSPKHQLGHFNLGIVALQSGDMAEAGSWFKKCLEIDPNSDTGKRARELYNQHTFTKLP